MRAKKIVCFFSVILLSSVFMYIVDALPDTTVTFRGGGVVIELTYPEEAQPNTNITHYITITSSTAATLQNFTVVIKAQVNSVWQEILNSQDTFSQSLPKSYNLNLSLPEEASGMLQYFIFVNTSIIDDVSTIFYTTLVSKPTFSEMLADYTVLQTNYTTLLNDYDGLLADYNSALANYTALDSEHNQLTAIYNAKVAAYQTLFDNYNKRSAEYDTLNANFKAMTNEFNILQSDYNELNSTYNSMLTDRDALQALYDELNQTYINLLTDLNSKQTDLDKSVSDLNNDRIVMFIFIIALVALVAFIIYLKRGKEEPYVVIRKETVNINQDENT